MWFAIFFFLSLQNISICLTTKNWVCYIGHTRLLELLLKAQYLPLTEFETRHLPRYVDKDVFNFSFYWFCSHWLHSISENCDTICNHALEIHVNFVVHSFVQHKVLNVQWFFGNRYLCDSMYSCRISFCNCKSIDVFQFDSNPLTTDFEKWNEQMCTASWILNTVHRVSKNTDIKLYDNNNTDTWKKSKIDVCLMQNEMPFGKIVCEMI